MATDFTSQITALHQTKTLVGLFKANYKTQPDLALEIYRTIVGVLGHPSQFLYRDQVMALCLARLEPKLVFDLIPPGGTTYKLAQLYDIYQAALTDETFRQATIDYFTQSGQTGNHVLRALTATPDSAIGEFLTGKIPQNFLEDTTLLRMALTLRLDGIWLAVEASPILPDVLAQLRPIELVKLTRRAVANPDLIQALTTLGLFQSEVYCAYVLLTRGSGAFSALVSQFVTGNTPVNIPAVSEQVVAWVADGNLELKPVQWQEIIEVIRNEAKISTLELFDEVNFATKVVMASHITNEGVRLKLSLTGALTGASVTPNTDLTTVMAKFQLTEADLMAVTAGDAADRYHISRLLPFYSGSAAVLNQFITKSVMAAHVLLEYDQDGHFTGLGPAVVPAWLYLVAISAGLTVPQHNHQVETLTREDAAVLSYWARRNYPKKVPAELVEFAEDMKLLLLEHQSIVEDIYLVTETHQDDQANEF